MTTCPDNELKSIEKSQKSRKTPEVAGILFDRLETAREVSCVNGQNWNAWQPG